MGHSPLLANRSGDAPVTTTPVVVAGDADRSLYELEPDPPEPVSAPGAWCFAHLVATCACVPRQLRADRGGLVCARCDRPYLPSKGSP